MDSRRLHYYLSEIGCGNDRIGAHRTVTDHCNDALKKIGFTSTQIADAEQSCRNRRSRIAWTPLAVQAFGAVNFSLKVHRYENAIVNHGLKCLHFTIKNWDQISTAYSVIDWIGLSNAESLTLTFLEHSIPITTFIIENSGELQELANILGFGAEVVALKVDVFDAIASAGLGLALTFAAKRLVKRLNAELRKQLEHAEEESLSVLRLHLLLASGALPEDIRKQINLVPEIVRKIDGFRDR